MDVCCDAKAQTTASMKVRTELLSPSPVIQILLITLQKPFASSWAFLLLEVIEKNFNSFYSLFPKNLYLCHWFKQLNL